MNSFTIFLTFAAVLFCVVCGEANQKLFSRSTGKCPSGFDYELDENSKTLTITGSGAFSHCRIDDYNQVKSVVIGDGFTLIGEGAFKGWSSLSSVTLPDSVSLVYDEAFCNTALTSFHVTKGLTAISGGAFRGCAKLAKFTIADGNIEYTVQNDILFRMENKVVVRYPPGKAGSSYTIPDNVKTVFGSCFENCTNLKNIVLPENLGDIAEYAFRSSGIKSIIIPAAVKRIYMFAFSNNTKLKYVKFLGTVDPLVNDKRTVFDDCPLLSEICVESTYKSTEFCKLPVNNACADPGSDSSSKVSSSTKTPSSSSHSSSKVSSSTKTPSSSSHVSSAVVHVPSIALALLLVFMLF